MRVLIAPVIGAALVIALAYAGLPKTLGAHPWWDETIALIGAPIGAILAGILAWLTSRRAPWILATMTLTLAGFAAAHTGKTRFAASFSEDAFAGQIWYLGWIATAAFAAAVLTLMFSPRR